MKNNTYPAVLLWLDIVLLLYGVHFCTYISVIHIVEIKGRRSEPCGTPFFVVVVSFDTGLSSVSLTSSRVV